MTIVERYQIIGEDRTAAAFRQIVRNSGDAAARMQKTFRNAFAGLSGLAIGRTVFNFSREAIDAADAMGTLAESFGTTTAELSRLDFAAKQNNTTIEELTSGLTAFQKNLVLAGEDSGRARKALAELRVDADRLIKLPLNRQLEEIADAFRLVENPAERVRIAAQLFGDEVGRKLIPILAAGKEGLRGFGEESDRLGATLTAEVVAKLQATDAEFKKIEASSMVLKRELALGLGPAFVTVGNWALKAAGGVKSFGEALAEAIHGPDEPVAIIQEKLGELAEQRAELLTTIRRLEAAPELVLPGALEKWKGALVDVEAEMNRLNSSLQQFGRDAEAAGGGGMEVVEKGAERARKAAELLREAIDNIRRDFPLTIAAGEAMLQRPLGPTAAENDAHLEQEFNAIRSENAEQTSRAIEVGEAFNFATKGAESLMSTLKDEGARQAFTALSDVIYNMGSGMDDFAESALNTFRRILANNLTKQLFELLGSVGGGGSAGGFTGFIGSLFSGFTSAPNVSGGGGRGFARGGFLPPGQWGIAGEEGPEPIFGGRTGLTVRPAGGGGNITVNAPVTVDARGASVELAKALPVILKQHGDMIESRLIEGLRRHRYQLG